jgi:hypothetical protein
MKIEFDLNPEKASDESKVSMQLGDDGSCIFKVYDCNENTSHMITKGEDGRNKLRRFQLAIELMLKHNYKNDGSTGH